MSLILPELSQNFALLYGYMFRALSISIFLLISCGSYSLASGSDVLVDSAFSGLCGDSSSKKEWSPSHIRFLQENALFPMGNVDSLKDSLKKVEVQTEMFKLPEKYDGKFEDLIPPMYDRAKVAINSGLLIKGHLLGLQADRLKSYKKTLAQLELSLIHI